MLGSEGFIETEGDAILRWDEQDIDQAWSDWRAVKDDFLANDQFKALTILVDDCLANLVAILRGEILSTDVIFPNSSMSKVEGLYKHNATADTFNQVVANGVVCYLKQRLADNPNFKLRILEIGAGTGGTSAIVFKALAPFKANMDEYLYTDLSKAFFFHAEQHYLPDNPYIVTRRLDVEQPIEDQGIELGSYDLVISTNALHATQNMRNTMRNAKAAMKKDGFVIINEMSYRSLSTHLTFGLLDGWWLFTDPDVRIEGCPGLYPHNWQRVLEDEGFNSVSFPVEQAHNLGNQIIVAKSDGVLRQPKAVPAKVARVAPVAQAAPVAKPVVATKPVASAPAKPKQNVADFIHSTILNSLSAALKIAANSIQTDMAFSDYGIDSILGVKFVDGINETLNIELNTAVIFEFASVDKLAEHVTTHFGSEIDGKRPQTPAVEVEAAPAPVAKPVAAPRAMAAPVAAPTPATVTTKVKKVQKPKVNAEQHIRQTIIDSLSSALKIAANAIDTDMAFSDYGIDSILGVKFVDNINDALGIDLNTAVIFEFRQR